MSGTLSGKAAIVTGASRGIGKAIAIELARNGADVLVCARSEQPDPSLPGTIGQTVEEIAAVGGHAVPLRVDIASDEDLRAMVETAQKEFGKIDILVNNAAYVANGAFLDSTIEDYDYAHRLNVRAAYLTTRLVAPSMIEHGGGVVFNITSGASRASTVPAAAGNAAAAMGWRMHPSYGVTKAALDRFTNAVALELYEQNVALIAINPGFTLTERVKMMLPPERQSSGNRPEDTAETIVELAQDPMQHTGQVIDVQQYRAAK